MKKGDFITIHYTGRLEDGSVFDTTREDVGKEQGVRGSLEPITICLGEGQLLPGLDKKLTGLEKGTHEITLEPEEAFGKKSAKKLELVPKNQLQAQNINPKPGMRLEIDGQYGIVKNVSGGRVVVDFNHPLASKKVTYEVEVIEKVDDQKTQVESILETAKIPYDSITVEDKHAIIKAPQLYPQHVMDAIQKKITQLTTIEDVSFEQGEKK